MKDTGGRMPGGSAPVSKHYAKVPRATVRSELFEKSILKENVHSDGYRGCYFIDKHKHNK